MGINAVIADVVTGCATGETALFFPNSKFKARHMNMYQHLSLRDSMPLVTMDTDEYDHTCATVHTDISQILRTCASINAVSASDYVVNSVPSFWCGHLLWSHTFMAGITPMRQRATPIFTPYHAT